MHVFYVHSRVEEREGRARKECIVGRRADEVVVTTSVSVCRKQTLAVADTICCPTAWIVYNTHACLIGMHGVVYVLVQP